jgi:hypothetical protein
MRNFGLGLCKCNSFIKYSWVIRFSYKQSINIHIWNYTVQVNLLLCMSWRHLGSGGVALLILNQDTRWCDWSASHSGCSHPKKMSQVPRLLFSRYKTDNLESNSRYSWRSCVQIDTCVITDIICCDGFFWWQHFGNWIFRWSAEWLKVCNSRKWRCPRGWSCMWSRRELCIPAVTRW